MSRSEPLLPACWVCERYGITTCALFGWLKDRRLALPRSIVINSSRYWSRDKLETWERAGVSQEVA